MGDTEQASEAPPKLVKIICYALPGERQELKRAASKARQSTSAFVILAGLNRARGGGQ